MQVYDDGVNPAITTLYFAGGMYKVQDSGGAGEKIIRYYGIAGQRVAMYDGTCASQGSMSESWGFTYDGDGVRVQEDYYNGTSTVTTLYFMGGMYELQDSGGGGEGFRLVWNARIIGDLEMNGGRIFLGLASIPSPTSGVATPEPPHKNDVLRWGFEGGSVGWGLDGNQGWFIEMK